MTRIELEDFLKSYIDRDQGNLWPLFANFHAFELAITAMIDPFRNLDVTKVVGIESRGYVVGSPIAWNMRVGFVAAMKTKSRPDCIVWDTTKTPLFMDYSGNIKQLELLSDFISPDDRVLIVDDWCELGTQSTNVATTIRKCLKATVVGISVLLDETSEELRELLIKHYNYHWVVHYDK